MALASSQIALTAASTYSQYQASKTQGRFQEQVAQENAALAEISAKDSIARGEKAAEQSKLRTRSLIGAQRAAMAAQGVDIASGSALDIQVDTAGQGALDALAIKNNAWRESFGFRAQAANYRTAGKMARLAARNEARSTLLTGGLQAVQAGVGGVDRRNKSKGTKYEWV